jgi:hypothetical protein
MGNNTVSTKSDSNVHHFVKIVLKVCVGIVVVVHVLLMTFESISLLCGLSGLAIQVLYIQFLKGFPSIQARSKLVCAACGMFRTNLLACARALHFSRLRSGALYSQVDLVQIPLRPV